MHESAAESSEYTLSIPAPDRSQSLLYHTAIGFNEPKLGESYGSLDRAVTWLGAIQAGVMPFQRSAEVRRQE
jgi:hypothetical protein